MKKSFFVLVCIILFCATAVPLFSDEPEILKMEALASFYAEDFHGRPTANGELFDMNALTAAHKTLPFGTMLEVTNLSNGKRVIVRVNDRGPFVPNREIDLSRAAAEKIDMIAAGVARVSIRKVSGPTGQEGTILVKKAGPAADFESTSKPVKPVQVSPKPATRTPGPVSSRPAGQTTWRIQLASFSHEANATRLAVTLRKQGFNPAFEKTASMIRVVLPGIADTDLSATRARLDSAGHRDYLVRTESR